MLVPERMIAITVPSLPVLFCILRRVVLLLARKGSGSESISENSLQLLIELFFFQPVGSASVEKNIAHGSN